MARGHGITEDDVERTIRDYLRVVLPPEVVCYHTPNGARMGARQVWEMRNAGMVAGIPDRTFVYDGRVYYAEVKSPKGRISEKQIEMHRRLRAAGAPVVVVRSVEQLEAALIEWGIPIKARMLPL